MRAIAIVHLDHVDPMRLNQILDFIAVAESGSIRAGAKARSASPPALTKSIRLLESELHVPLLTRTTRGVVVSRYGHAFLVRARLIANEARKASEEMAQMLGERNSLLRVGASGGPAHTLLPAVLKRFHAQYPQVQVSLEGGTYAAHAAKLRSGSMDMAIAPLADDGIERDFCCEPLYRNESMVMAHPQHALRHARTLRELSGSSWILTSQGMHGPGASILDAFRERDLPQPHVALRSDSIGIAQLLLLSDPTLLCLLPRQLLQGQSGHNGLVALQIEDKLPSHMVHLIYLSDNPMTPIAADFATQLRREAHYLTV